MNDWERALWQIGYVIGLLLLVGFVAAWGFVAAGVV
jgi:hypothetical protein